MSASNPGPVRRFFRGAWRVVDVSRRVVLNLSSCILIAVVLALASGAARSRSPRRPRWCSPSTARSPSSAPATCARPRSTSCAARPRRRRCSCATSSRVLDAAAKDDEDLSAVAVLDELDADRPRDAARDRAPRSTASRPSGKKVVAWGSSYDQRQYYIAAHADEVYLHPLGTVYVTGFGGAAATTTRTRSTSSASASTCVRVGTFKASVEPYVANEPSPEAREADDAAATARSGRPTPTRSRRRASSRPAR